MGVRLSNFTSPISYRLYQLIDRFQIQRMISERHTTELCLVILFMFQLLDVDPQDQGEEDGANIDLDSQRKGKCAVIKTSTRQVAIFV